MEKERQPWLRMAIRSQDAIDHEEVARLAYQLWTERGRPLGSPERDWFAAQARLDMWHSALVPAELGGVALEPDEGSWSTQGGR